MVLLSGSHPTLDHNYSLGHIKGKLNWALKGYVSIHSCIQEYSEESSSDEDKFMLKSMSSSSAEHI